MTSAGPPLRTVAFGDADSRTWGAAWALDRPRACTLALANGARSEFVSPSLDGADPSGRWSLTGDDAELTISPLAEAVLAEGDDVPLRGFDQLCRVHGHFLLEGREHKVDCLGHRASRTDAIDFDRFGSVREISAWFEPDAGVAVVALRPRKSRGHDSDALFGALLNVDRAVAVSEARLSSTFAGAEWPARLGLELWLGEEEEHFPERAAGEAVGDGARDVIGEVQVDAGLLRCHSRGREGTGVHLLIRGR